MHWYEFHRNTSAISKRDCWLKDLKQVRLSQLGVKCSFVLWDDNENLWINCDDWNVFGVAIRQAYSMHLNLLLKILF